MVFDEAESLRLGAIGALIVFVALALFAIMRFVTADCDMTMLHYASIPKNGFQGTVVWITGASSGIGEGLAYELSCRGAEVVLSARRKDLLERVAEKCKIMGAKEAHVVPFDVSDIDSHPSVVALVLKTVRKIDVLVNNAGRSQRSLAEDTSPTVDRQMVELNVLAPISLTKAVLPHMLKRKSGHIVITSSVAGKVGAPCASTYSATKHACQGFFDALRAEVADRNISVTSICPGPVWSDISNNAFTGVPGQKVADLKPKQDSSPRVSTKRCAFLMAAAIFHRLDEVWIALHPILLFTYVAQYAPAFGKAMSRRIGPQRVANFRAGIFGHDFSKKKK